MPSVPRTIPRCAVLERAELIADKCQLPETRPPKWRPAAWAAVILTGISDRLVSTLTSGATVGRVADALYAIEILKALPEDTGVRET